MLATVDAELAELEEEEELIELAPGEVSLDFLQRIYRSTQQPMSLRMRAAIEALPFEKPKLSATAIAAFDGGPSPRPLNDVSNAVAVQSY
jgi:hypothetical protein